MKFFTGKDYRDGEIRAFRTPGIAPTNLDRFLDQIEAEYLTFPPKIAAARKKLDEARHLVVSREEVMRIMSLVVRDYSERDYSKAFQARIETIWTDPSFDEKFTFSCDPLLDQIAQGQGPALADAFYYLLPDLILDGIRKRVEAVIPKSARGTLAEQRKAIAEAEATVNDLERQAAELLSQYRTILDSREAQIGDHRKPPEPTPILQNTLPDLVDDSVAESSQPSSYLAGQDAARLK
jgi:hypothetical protein